MSELGKTKIDRLLGLIHAGLEWNEAVLKLHEQETTAAREETRDHPTGRRKGNQNETNTRASGVQDK